MKIPKISNLKDPVERKRVFGLLGKLLLICVGSALYAIGFRYFLYPNDIVSGGITGVAMIINYITGWPIGVMVIIMNVPLFAVAWKKLGTGFMVASLIGTAVSSVLVDVFALFDFTATGDLLLACIFGGVIKGAGWGLVYLTGATGGGVDIVAKFVRLKRPDLNFGSIILLLDVLVVAVFAVTFGLYDRAMYSIIAIFISTQAIDFILYGSAVSKLCYIITDKSKEIKEDIQRELHRGVTYLHGEGTFTGRPKEVILCVIKRQQIVTLRRIVRERDENAFIIISDARNVFGKGFTSIRDNT